MGRFFGTRAWTRRLKSHTLLDRIAEHSPREFTRVRKTRGKLKKDDYYWQSVRDSLENKNLLAQIRMRKGRYEPSQIVRNFFRS